MKKENVPSLGKGKGIIVLFITLLTCFIILIFCCGFTPVYNIQPAGDALKTIEKNTIDNYIQNLKQQQGYEGISAKESYIIKIARENHIPMTQSNNFPSPSSKIILSYDYYTTYYYTNVDGQEYVFKTQSECQDFINKINNYDNNNYEIKTKQDFIKKETSTQEAENIISAKKDAYEQRLKEEAEVRQKREEAAAAAQKKENTIVTIDNNLSALQLYAHDLVINQYNWSESDFQALVALWNRESGWNPNSHNSKSGAHGIPQAIPASKMASEGSDYLTNGQTQIRWGLKYIYERYKTPSNAWSHSQSTGWY